MSKKKSKMTADIPSSQFVFIYSNDTQVILDEKTGRIPSESYVNDSAISWNDVMVKHVKKVFETNNDKVLEGLAKESRMIRMLRLWYPLHSEDHTYVERITFYKKIPQELCENLKVNDGYKWQPVQALLSDHRLDPESEELLRQLKNQSETQIGFCGRELTEEEFVFDPSATETCPSARKVQAILMKGANFSQKDQRKIYRMFVSNSFPLFYMNRDTFAKIMLKFGWDGAKIKDLFRCFKIKASHNNPNFLSYPEFITGLAACEQLTPHGELCGEARCRYIFRYYDKNNDGNLDFTEFLDLVKDIRAARGASLDPEDVKADAETSAKLFEAQSNSLKVAEFLTFVGQLKFRGTSVLLRTPNPVLEVLETEFQDDNGDCCDHACKRQKLDGHQQSKDFDPCQLVKDSVSDLDDISMPSAFSLMGEEAYEFATHVVKVKRSGHISNVSSLWEMDANVLSASTDTLKDGKETKFKFERMDSIRAFNVSSEANEMLKGLRYFERSFSSKNPDLGDKEAYSWGPVDMATVASALINLCQQVRDIFLQEPRLLRLQPPVYVLGDVHGNFRDLVSFEKALWRLGIPLTPANFLFLGDYVDRGQHSVEVVAYMFSQKVISPNKFHMLRGNHELRRVQEHFTFYTECMEKFGGGELAKKVWESVNKAFDAMPIASVVDNKIFCVHGGIPPPWMPGQGLIKNLDKVSNDIADPEEEEPIVWEYLWNDPLAAENRGKLPPDATVDKTGFADNFRRGTGHLFSDEALDNFLLRNSLSHVIRAHEVKEAGFQVQHKKKLLTVFSSSRYCNGSNDCACVLIDGKKLRLIRLDTS